MSTFGLIKSFDIDHGELDDISKQESFVLGYELATIDALLKSTDEISQLVHAENQHRVRKSCLESKREFKLTWMAEDPSESWLMLSVKPIKG